MKNKRITSALIHELANSTAMDPVLIRFCDTGEYRVVPAPFLSDISWCDYQRQAERIISRSALLDCWTEHGHPSEITPGISRWFADQMNRGKL